MAVDRNELILQFKYQAQKANAGIDKTNKKIGGLRLSTSGLRRSVGALRNNLLLVSFAFGAVATSMTKLISASTRFESIRTRLVGLTGSVENAQKAFANFNEVAATTPFSLEDVVNAGAQLKAFGADANALIKPITDLAAFMGTTAVEAANSFGRAFAGGAGAADILRERGILNIIKSSQGIEDLSKITLPEFRQALISALQDPVVGIQGSTDRLSKTFEGSVSNMRDALTRLSVSTGDALKDFFQMDKVVAAIGKRASEMAKQISLANDPVKALSERIEALGLENEHLAKATEQIKIDELKNKIIEEDEAIANLAESVEILRSDLLGVDDLFVKSSKNLGVMRTSTKLSNIEFIKSTDNFKALADVIDPAIDKISKLVEEAQGTDALKRLVPQLEKLVELRKLLQVQNEELSDDVELLPDFELPDPEMFAEVMMSFDRFRNGVKFTSTEVGAFIENLEDQDVKIKNVSTSLDFLDSTQKAVLEGVQGISRNMATAILNAQNMRDAFVSSIKAMAAEIMAQAATFALLNFFTGGTFGAGRGFLDFAFGHTGGLVNKSGIQKLHEGGMIGGNFNNVPIVAQSGEFIMQRSAVQSIGLDNLSAMNETGQANNIVVNIHGGVVQEDYVRNELIPAINRSGARVA
jgi:hypothetical protein